MTGPSVAAPSAARPANPHDRQAPSVTRRSLWQPGWQPRMLASIAGDAGWPHLQQDAAWGAQAAQRHKVVLQALQGFLHMQAMQVQLHGKGGQAWVSCRHRPCRSRGPRHGGHKGREARLPSRTSSTCRQSSFSCRGPAGDLSGMVHGHHVQPQGMEFAHPTKVTAIPEAC